MAIDGGQNAALFAVQILSVSDGALADRLSAYKESMARKVMEKDAKIAKEALQ